MARADVLQLITQLAVVPTSNDLIERLADDAVRLLGEKPILAQVSTLAIDPLHDDISLNTLVTQGTFTLPDEALTLHAVFYGDRLLDWMPLDDLEVLSPRWRNETGDPVAYTTLAEHERTFRLYPRPYRPSDDLDILLGMPFGLGQGSYGLILITSLMADPPQWLELPQVLTVLARLFTLESRWRDPEFAQHCTQLLHVLSLLLTRL